MMNNNIRYAASIFLCLLLSSVNSFSQNARISGSTALMDFTSSNLPIFVINTNGQPIPSDEKITADLGVIYNGEGVRNFLSDPFNHYNGKIGIEIRGSTSQMFPKKSYAVETRDSLGNDLNFPLLNFPSESDWVLYAPYSDKSLIRDVIAYDLFARMNHYASRYKFCEVVLNGDYIGVYVLLEKIKRGANRVDIKKLNPADTTGDALTGGYIIKIDKLDGEANDGWFSPFPPFTGAWQRVLYQYHYPKPNEITVQQQSYIQNYISEFEAFMYSNQFNRSDSSYYNMIDINSAVDYFLLNEFTKNVDSYRLSFFMYKDRTSVNDKLFFGPVWDYNIALGNADYYDAGYPEGWMMDYLISNNDFLMYDQFQPPFWWRLMFVDPNFQNSVNDRWNELRQSIFSNEVIDSFIDSLVVYLDESQQRNFERWQILGIYVWPNFYIGLTYEDEVNYLKNWIHQRLLWMESNMIGNTSQITLEGDLIDEFQLYQNYPNPFNQSTIIRYTVPASINGGDVFVQLKIYDVLGKETASLVNTVQNPGSREISFDAENLSSGVYFIRLQIYSAAEEVDLVQTRKIVLLK